jgi:hypothetical protein
MLFEDLISLLRNDVVIQYSDPICATFIQPLLSPVEVSSLSSFFSFSEISTPPFPPYFSYQYLQSVNQLASRFSLSSFINLPGKTKLLSLASQLRLE